MQTIERKIPEKIPLREDLHLRLVSIHDANSFFKIITISQDYFSKFDFLAPKFQTLQETEFAVADLIQKQHSHRGASYGLWQEENLLGLFKINRFDWDDLSADVGYWLIESASNKGFARASLTALIENCWSNLDLKSVTAHTAVTNLRSHALLEKLGFKKIKLIKNAIQIEGKNIDDFVFQILRP